VVGGSILRDSSDGPWAIPERKKCLRMAVDFPNEMRINYGLVIYRYWFYKEIIARNGNCDIIMSLFLLKVRLRQYEKSKLAHVRYIWGACGSGR
jgi:hypothetical protein